MTLTIRRSRPHSFIDHHRNRSIYFERHLFHHHDLSSATTTSTPSPTHQKSLPSIIHHDANHPMLAPSLLHLPTLKPNPSVNADVEVLYYESLAMSVMRLADLQEQREFHILDQSKWIEMTYLFLLKCLTMNHLPCQLWWVEREFHVLDLSNWIERTYICFPSVTMQIHYLLLQQKEVSCELSDNDKSLVQKIEYSWVN